MLTRVKALEHQGFEFEAADGSLALLIRRALVNAPPPFFVDAYHVSVRRDTKESVCEAVVKVRVRNESEHRVAEGDGPVNALDAAACRARPLPGARGCQADYKVRILDSTSGTMRGPAC
jgi:2-isopropylmalate synthase